MVPIIIKCVLLHWNMVLCNQSLTLILSHFFLLTCVDILYVYYYAQPLTYICLWTYIYRSLSMLMGCNVMQCNQMQCMVCHGMVRVSRPLQSSADVHIYIYVCNMVYDYMMIYVYSCLYIYTNFLTVYVCMHACMHPCMYLSNLILSNPI
jgi:hypothetical protein